MENLTMNQSRVWLSGKSLDRHLNHEETVDEVKTFDFYRHLMESDSTQF